VCAMVGRPLTAGELQLPTIERQLLMALWAFKRLGRYCYYLPKVQIMLPNPAELSMLATRELPVRIQAKLIELSSLGVSYGCGMGAWQLQGELGKVIMEPPEPVEERLDLPCWEHRDFELDFPAKLAEQAR
jgi:hypothetical protein